MEQLNDIQLAKRCQQGDKAAEKELFYRFAPRVLSLCRRYAQDDDTAKDYLQECFIKLYKELPKFNPNKGDFRPWMYRVCTNQVLSFLRKKSWIELVNMPENISAEEPSPPFWEKIHPEHVIEAIRDLPQGYRVVFNMYVLDGYSHKEIATSLNITESSSRSQLTRAKKMLRKKLLDTIPGNYEKRLAGK